MPQRHRQEAAEPHHAESVRHRALYGNPHPRNSTSDESKPSAQWLCENRLLDASAPGERRSVPFSPAKQQWTDDNQLQHVSRQRELSMTYPPANIGCTLDSGVSDSAIAHAGRRRPPLTASLRWLQLCLLMLFVQDVFCFSLGYPFLPQYLAAHGRSSTATSLAFGIYGLVSIITHLLLLFISSNTASSSSIQASSSRPATKFWIILCSTSLAAIAGAVNTAVPESYTVLLVTKAVQGAASALYFVYSLGLVATAYPAAYRTQAMAFVSAGLTLGDALGPVAGGLVYQAAGLRAALGMQPLASGLALVLLLVLLLWPDAQRPWHIRELAGQQQQQQQQQPSQKLGMCGNSGGGDTVSDLAAPLLPQHTIAAAPAASKQQQQQESHLLLRLLRNQGVVSLCLLALMCQAARTAVDLLLPMMLGGSVQPGVIGFLFGGEAVGSVLTPFAVDWLLQRTVEPHQPQHSSSSSSSGGEILQQQEDSSKRSSTAGCSSSSSSSAAAWLLLMSAIGMAVCCCLVLVAWQLPAAACQATCPVQQQQQQCLLPHWICPTVVSALPQGASPPAAALATTAAAVDPSAADSTAIKPSRSSSSSSSRRAAKLFSPHAYGTADSPVRFRGNRLGWCVAQAYADLVPSNRSTNSTSSGILGRDAIASSTSDQNSSILDDVRGAFVEAVSMLDSPKFGLLQLLLTGLVLLLLGGCHSSCETLIYTVLTDLAMADGWQDDSSRKVQPQEQQVDSAEGFQVCSQTDGLSSAGLLLGWGDAKSSDNSGKQVLQTKNQHRAGHQQRHHPQQQEPIVPSDSLVDDPREVVMVLYVLFWVVGFTVGAAVAGVPSSDSILQQQTTAVVMGVLLAGSAVWSWRSASA